MVSTRRKKIEARKTAPALFFEFDQNNSGGFFHIDDEAGIGPRVWIEAPSAERANLRAVGLGLYWNGVRGGVDCGCCGDRWYPAWSGSKGHEKPEISAEWDFNWHPTVYVHRMDGTIERITKPAV